MAITFKKKIKKQKNLIFVFIIVIVVAVLVVWKAPDIFGPEITPDFTSLQFKKIEIDFIFFENPFLKELLPFEKMPKFEGEPGRVNPFVSP